MRIDGLFSLRSGEVLLPDGQPATLEVTELGTLRVPSGRLAVCDALWLQFPNVVPIPPGDHPVAVTIARVPEHYEYRGCREVSLSLILSEEPTVSVHPAVFERDSLDLDEQPIGGIAGVRGLYGVGTSRFATVAMADAEASAHSVPSEADRWLEEVLRPEGGRGLVQPDGHRGRRPARHAPRRPPGRERRREHRDADRARPPSLPRARDP